MTKFGILLTLICLTSNVDSNENARQLYEDLLAGYNSIARPVQNATDILTVKFGASLIRIIDIDEKNQVLTTNLWLEIQWKDSKLQWRPERYGGIKKLHIPSTELWKPDIVLYNNAAGNPEITIFNDALVYFDGTVAWKPPTIYKSFCDIDVTWFPYDEQFCHMKFGMWTYTGSYVDMRQLPEESVIEIPEHRDDGTTRMLQYLSRGMDLSYYYTSAEWDLLNITSTRHEEIYGSCCGPEKYIDISYKLRIRRKTLFYTVNLTIPCALISFLTTYVFYLPAHSDKKITFAISILVSLTVFFLVLIDMIPPTSVVIPLFGKYLTFTMVLVSFSIVISVVTVNIHHRNGNTHKMPYWIRVVFLCKLPYWLLISSPRAIPKMSFRQPSAYSMGLGKQSPSKRRHQSPDDDYDKATDDVQQIQLVLSHSPGSSHAICQRNAAMSLDRKRPTIAKAPKRPLTRAEEAAEREIRFHKLLFHRVIHNVQIIAHHFKEIEMYDEISADWTFVAMVIDRLFLGIFSVCNVVGTIVIILQAPTFYDTTMPIIVPSPTRPLGGDTLTQQYNF